MPVLSYRQAHEIFRQTGWPENLIVTMGAIAMAESSLNTCGPVGTIAPGESSHGLLQINLGSGLNRPYTRAQLCDPYFNSRVALSLYNDGRGLRHWGAYTHPVRNPRYLQFMAASQAAYGQPAALGVPQSQPGTLPSIFPSTSGAFDFLQENSGGITTGAIGIFLISLGLIIFIRR